MSQRYDKEGIRYILGQKWYRLLKLKDMSCEEFKDYCRQSDQKPWRALLNDHSEANPMMGHLIVCQMDREGIRLYSLFEDYAAFYNYQIKFTTPDRSFYEVIIGQRKPIFDIDIDLTNPAAEYFLQPDGSYDTWLLCQILIDTIVKILKRYNIPLQPQRNIVWFSSHGPDKHSYHLVLDGYCHPDHNEAAYFYQLVITELPDDIKERIHTNNWIDHKVYNSKQQFRILGSQKLGSDRPKQLIETWYSYVTGEVEWMPIIYPDSAAHYELMILSSSLASFTSACKMLPNFDPDRLRRLTEASTRKWDLIENDIEATSEEIRCAMDKAKVFWKTFADGSFPYSLIKARGTMLLLKRIRPAFCPKCSRIHHSENAFMHISNKQIFLNCRRSSDGKSFLIRTPEMDINTMMDNFIDNLNIDDLI